MTRILGVKQPNSTAIGHLPYQGFQVIDETELKREEAGAGLDCNQSPKLDGWYRFMRRLERTAAMRGLKRSQERGA